MKDNNKSKTQCLDELEAMRQRVAQLEKKETQYVRMDKELRRYRQHLDQVGEECVNKLEEVKEQFRGRVIQYETVEEELDKRRKSLEKLIEERTTELERMDRKLQQEVEERRRAEDALQDSARRFRNLVEKNTCRRISMPGQIESLLEQGIYAARDYDYNRALEILIRLIELDHYN